MLLSHGSHELPLGPGRLLIDLHAAVLKANLVVHTSGIGSVFVCSGGHLRILHASAALGTAAYVPDGATWRLARSFNWDCGEPASIETRAAYRRREGWIANVAHGGADRHFEIDLPRFASSGEHELRIAFGYHVISSQASFVWPQTVKDAASSADLHMGFTPALLHASPEHWALLMVGDVPEIRARRSEGIGRTDS